MDADTQVTSASVLSAAPTFGEITLVHAVPSQCSIKVRATPASADEPTAQQLDDDAQLTPVSALSDAATFGEDTIAHEVPSQRSISVCVTAPLVEEPTAQQTDADTHAMSERTLCCEALALGDVTITHDVPPQRWMRDCRIPLPVEYPTAQQSDADTQVRSARMLSPVFRLGEPTVAHDVPFQRSVRVRRGLPVPVK